MARVGLTVLFFAGAIYSIQAGWHQIADYNWRLNPPLVVVAMMLFVGATLLGNMIWLLLMRSFGAHIALRPALRVYCTSNLGKYLPGKVWHVFARIYLAQQYGAPVARATSGSVADVLIFVAAGCVVSVLALPTLLGWAIEVPLLIGLMLVASTVIGALLHPVILNALFDFTGKRRFQASRRPTGSWISIDPAYLWPRSRPLGPDLRRRLHRRPLGSPGINRACADARGYLRRVLHVWIDHAARAGRLGVREGATIFFLAPLVGAPAAVVSTALIRVLQVLAESLCAAVFSRL